MPIRDIIVLSIVFCTIPMIFFRARIGIYLWCWLGYMNPHRLGWGVASQFPLSAITAGITIISLFYSKNRKNIKIDLTLLVWFLFIIWMTITTWFAIFPELAKDGWIKVMKIQLMTGVSLLLINDRKSLDYMIWIITLSRIFWC